MHYKPVRRRRSARIEQEGRGSRLPRGGASREDDDAPCASTEQDLLTPDRGVQLTAHDATNRGFAVSDRRAHLSGAGAPASIRSNSAEHNAPLRRSNRHFGVPRGGQPAPPQNNSEDPGAEAPGHGSPPRNSGAPVPFNVELNVNVYQGRGRPAARVDPIGRNDDEVGPGSGNASEQERESDYPDDNVPAGAHDVQAQIRIRVNSGNSSPPPARGMSDYWRTPSDVSDEGHRNNEEMASNSDLASNISGSAVDTSEIPIADLFDKVPRDYEERPVSQRDIGSATRQRTTDAIGTARRDRGTQDDRGRVVSGRTGRLVGISSERPPQFGPWSSSASSSSSSTSEHQTEPSTGTAALDISRCSQSRPPRMPVRKTPIGDLNVPTPADATVVADTSVVSQSDDALVVFGTGGTKTPIADVREPGNEMTSDSGIRSDEASSDQPIIAVDDSAVMSAADVPAQEAGEPAGGSDSGRRGDIADRNRIMFPTYQDLEGYMKRRPAKQAAFEGDEVVDNADERVTGEFNLQAWIDEFRNFDSAAQAEAIATVLASSNVPQLRHLLTVLRKCRPEFIYSLPVKQAALVISYFDPNDADARNLLNEKNDKYWETRCRELKIKPPRITGGKDARYTWRQEFIWTRYAVNWNWCFVHQPVHTVIRYHGPADISCLDFLDGHVVTGSNDHTLRLFNATTGALLHVFHGHRDRVLCVKLKKTIAISGSADGTLKVWFLETGQCVRTLTGHTQAVTCIDVHNDWVASGSSDNSVRLWNHTTGECLRVYAGHTGGTTCVALSKTGDHIVSGGADKIVRMWSSDQTECVRRLAGHTEAICTLAFDGDYIATGGLDGAVRVWNTEGRRLVEVNECDGLMPPVALQGDTFVTASSDHTIRLCDLRTPTVVKALVGHEAPVTSLQINANFIISGSSDGRTKLWSRRTGEYLRDLFTIRNLAEGQDQEEQQQQPTAREAVVETGIRAMCADNTTLVAAFKTGEETANDTRLGIFHFDLNRPTSEESTEVATKQKSCTVA